jgi:hypothetical protein
MNESKIFVLAPQESWICDRFVEEWYRYNSEISTHDPRLASTIWLLADWCWNHLPKNILEQKKVIATVHHITPGKFGHSQIAEFMERDRYIDVYHVPCDKTAKQISGMTNKPIIVQPFWVNNKIWFDDKFSGKSLRNSLAISDDTMLIGSFQRDTEGHDLKSPKLEKGPDVFCDAIEKFAENNSVEVLLGGWRRQYVIGRLQKAGIKFHYCELPNFSKLNQMYNALDLYIVGARWEGGPQSIVECASTRTPIFSTDVGLASMFLKDENLFSIDEVKTLAERKMPDVDYPFSKVKDYWIPDGFSWFRNKIVQIEN